MAIFKGAGVAIATPMKENLEVNYDKLDEMLEEQIAGGTDAIVICGTTGESATMTEEEHAATIRFAIERVNHRIPVIAGTGSNCTRTAIQLSKEAQEDGADGILLVTPYYNKATQNGLIAHYTAICNEVNIPAILYNVPSRTGCGLQPQTVATLVKDVENIVGIKEASGNISTVAQIMHLCDGNVDLYSGNDDQVVPLLALGGKGVISVLSNVAPRETHDMVMKFLEGDVKGSLDIQLKYMDVIHNLFSEVNPIPAKRAVAEMGYCKNIVDVYYGGSEEEWKEMYIGSDNEYLKNATLHFNSTALPTAEFSVITEEDKVYVKNISEISGSIAVITTKYNDGILLDIQVERMIMLPSEEKYLFIPKNGRIFIWNSLKGMKPLSNEL